MLTRSISEMNYIQSMIDAALPHDWPGDFHLENGCYYNSCLYCKCEFLGYKRRTMCRTCDSRYVHLRCHDCKYRKMWPIDTPMDAMLECWYCQRSHRRSWYIELPEESR